MENKECWSKISRLVPKWVNVLQGNETKLWRCGFFFFFGFFGVFFFNLDKSHLYLLSFLDLYRLWALITGK